MSFRPRLFLFLAAFWLAQPAAWAVTTADFRCEVLGLEGTVTLTNAEGATRELKKGDVLKPGDILEAGAESYADLAYDKDWQNVTRLEPNTKVKISSIVPGRLALDTGAVFAKLRKLPQDSSFEVRTPTAVATVRGSEYRTSFADGQTDVFNAASSQIIVYGLTEDGSKDRDSSVILEQDKKTSVEKVGEAPQVPVAASPEEKSAADKARGGIETNVKEAVKEGRSANIQTVTEIETYIREEIKKAQSLAPPNESELSRVTDSRRRAFGGGERVLAPPDPQPPAESEPAEDPPSGPNA